MRVIERERINKSHQKHIKREQQQNGFYNTFAIRLIIILLNRNQCANHITPS